MNRTIQEQQLKIVKQLLGYVDEEKAPLHVPQPVFVVGSGGAGKSTILSLLTTYLEKSDDSRNYIILDGKRFFNSTELIAAMETQRGNDENQEERVVVLVDDIDHYFNRSSFEDQYRLRSYLGTETSPMLIATISGIGDSLANYRAPFFEGIRTVYIPAFNELTLAEMNMTTESFERISNLLAFLPPVVRSFKIASDIVSITQSRANDLKELLDRFGPDYRRILDGLPLTSQKILQTLANSETPLTLATLRELTGLSSGILSSYIRQLIKGGIIVKTEIRKRDAPYEIQDRLFKLWLFPDRLKPPQSAG